MAITPFEHPDEKLAIALNRAGVLSVLDLGYSPEKRRKALAILAKTAKNGFGVRIPKGVAIDPDSLPENATHVVVCAGADISAFRNRKVLVQVSDFDEACIAEADGAFALIAKGSESAGPVKDLSSFILLQRLIDKVNIPVWLQGGCGVHTSAAAIAAGAEGVVLDSQLALLRESSLSPELKKAFKGLDGTETKVYAGRRILVRPDSPPIDESVTEEELVKQFGELDIKTNFIPMGQDISFASSFNDD